MTKAYNEIPDSVFGFQLIEKILQALEYDGINYCILRNSNSVLGRFPSGDVDILVDKVPWTFRHILKIIHRLQGDFGFIVYASGNHANVSRNIYLATSVAGVLYTINLEFFTEVFVYKYKKFKSKKYVYLDTKSVLKNRIRRGVIYSSSIEYEIVHKVVDSLFNDKISYYQWLNDKITHVSHKKKFQKIALKTLGEQAAYDLSNVNWVSEDSHLLSDLKLKISKHLIKEGKFPFFSELRRDFCSIFQHINQYFFCKGLFCLILGTDGSGKTSVCDSIGERRKRSFNKIHRIHLGNRPIFLGSLRGGKINHPSNQVVDKPHKNYHEYDLESRRITVYQSLRLIYTAVDFILHYWFIIRPLLARGDMILTERYFTDYVIIPERYFPLAPSWLKRLCFRFIPKPHVTIHLSTGMTQILRRKKELSDSLLKHEIREFKKYAQANNYPIISNSGHIEKAIDNIEKIIFNRGVRK